MTTYTVSSKSQLTSTISKAKSGDSIVLKSGNYGSLAITSEKFSSNVKISSESSSNPATFSSINIKSSSNLTFDNIKMVGTGTGFKVSGSSNVTLQNSDLANFTKGIQLAGGSNLKFINNDLNNIRYDGLVAGHVQGMTIQGNEIHMNGQGDSHRDAIQFYNQGPSAPSANIVIKGNQITTNDGVTHGIYFGNYDTKGGAITSEFYKNITIEGNSLKTGQMLGIAIGGTQGVSIRNNTVVQTDAFSSKKTINIPLILVDKDAKGVTVSGNTVLKAPVIADDANNWKIVGTLANTGSKIVSLGATVSNSSRDDSSSSSASSSSSSSSLSSSSSSLGDGDADTFRFKGSSVNGTKTNKISADFSEGDKIVLAGYDNGTFKDIGGGNRVDNSKAGDYVKIDSLTDLQELVKASQDISAKVSGDNLTISIDQGSDMHHLVLAGLGQEYQSSYVSTLF